MFTMFPELVRCAWAHEEEKLALLAHRYFGSGEPLRGRTDFEDMLSKAGITLCYTSDSESYGTLFVKEDRGLLSPIFCIQKDLDWVEQKFLIAHLLGRLLFDHQIKIVTGHFKATGLHELHSPYQRYLICRRPRNSLLSLQASRVEWFADEFAGAFLLPKQWLRKFVEVEKEPLLIAAHFSIPLDFLHARIKHIRQKNLETKISSTPHLRQRNSYNTKQSSLAKVRELGRHVSSRSE